MGQPDEFLEDVARVTKAVAGDLEGVSFAQRMDDTDDLLAYVIRAHLFAQRELTQIIEAPLPRPERLRRNWSYAHQLELVAALGIVGDDDLPALEYLDELRNRLAHRLDYELSVNEQEAMLSRIPAPLAEAARRRDPAFPQPLKWALKLIVVRLSLARHGLVNPATEAMREGDSTRLGGRHERGHRTCRTTATRKRASWSAGTPRPVSAPYF